MARSSLVLASGSPRRLALLRQIGIEPDRLWPADIDEAPRPHELPRVLVRRLARAKAELARERCAADPEYAEAFVLAADTVVAVGRRILPKAETEKAAIDCLSLLSGRAHRVYTGLCLVTRSGAVRERIVESRVRFKRLSLEDTTAYLATGEWRGKAGGYAIQGKAAAFVAQLSGSYSAVVGLPLHEAAQLLEGNGYPLLARWGNGGSPA